MKIIPIKQIKISRIEKEKLRFRRPSILINHKRHPVIHNSKHEHKHTLPRLLLKLLNLLVNIQNLLFRMLYHSKTEKQRQNSNTRIRIIIIYPIHLRIRLEQKIKHVPLHRSILAHIITVIFR